MAPEHWATTHTSDTSRRLVVVQFEILAKINGALRAMNAGAVHHRRVLA
jgi:hypothetical protein